MNVSFVLTLADFRVMHFACSRAFCKMSLGSAAKALPVGLKTLQISRQALLSGRDQGIMAKVDKSGFKRMSLSAIRAKPSIEEPSNQMPCSKISASFYQLPVPPPPKPPPAEPPPPKPEPPDQDERPDQELPAGEEIKLLAA